MNLPKNKIMVAGPTEMEGDVRECGAKPMVYNRTREFSDFMFGIERRLKALFKTKNDVYIMASSGTGAMEAAVVNVLTSGSEAVILSGGTFGHRWFEIAERYGARCRLVEVGLGESVRPELICEAITQNTRAVFVTANETSTGVVIDLQAIGKAVSRTEAILVVDAVSSLGSDDIDTDGWQLDVVISSSQKALALPPGLSFITISEKAWKLIESSDLPKYYFDLKAYRENMPRGQTPFTPPISLLYQLDARLKKIERAGIDNIIELQHKKSVYLRKRLQELGLTVIGKHPSNGVVGILFPESIDASWVVGELRTGFNIEITPSPGKDRHRIARVGLFGSIERADIDHLIEAVSDVLKRARAI